MRRRDFVGIVLLSTLLSSGLIILMFHWPSPPPARAEFQQEVSVFPDAPLSSDEETNIRIYRELSQSVVNITSTRLRYGFWMRIVPEKGTGSGFFIDREGHILTNNHVIEDSDRLEVTLFDETTVEAKIVGRDPVTDIALLKIDCNEVGCSAIKLAEDFRLVVGQKVLAIGNPFGLQRTLTTGIISSLNRTLESEDGILDELIQTDAAINPGNSGGPLLNTRGEVIGINTAIVSRTGESAGVGFAVPVSTISRILPDLLERGRVIRAWVGIQEGRPLGRKLARILDLPVDKGFLVERVASGSSADLAGIRGGRRTVWAGNTAIRIGGDVLVSMDGKPVKRGRDILQIAQDKRPGDEMEFVFYRGNKKLEKRIELVGRERRRYRF
jgi:putative serine protease PepD